MRSERGNLLPLHGLRYTHTRTRAPKLPPAPTRAGPALWSLPFQYDQRDLAFATRNALVKRVAVVVAALRVTLQRGTKRAIFFLLVEGPARKGLCSGYDGGLQQQAMDAHT